MNTLVILIVIFVFIITCMYTNNNDNVHNVNVKTKPFIGLELEGGLCNQLFQVAMGYSLAKKQGKNLVVVQRNYNPHSDSDYFQTILRKIKYDPYGINNVQIIYKEKNEDAMKYVSIPDFKENVLMRGYFQTELYFKPFERDILELFEIEEERRQYLLEKYGNSLDCYFIHIRRGDYLKSGMHNVDLDLYYTRSISYIQQLDKNAKFMIFSNDIPYCKQARFLRGLNLMFIEEKDELNNLYLMSMCKKGGIAANSSFSWWGGYLGKLNDHDNNRIVTYPSKWLNTDWEKDIGWKGCVVVNVN